MTNDTKMMYLWITDYTANTLAYVAQKHAFLKYNLTADNFPANNRSFMNTTCKLLCIGKLIPQIGSKYPNMQVDTMIASTATPSLTMTQKSITLTTQFNASLYATPFPKGLHNNSMKMASYSSSTPAFLLTLGLNLSLSFQANIQNERLVGKITDSSFKVAVLKSAVGNVSSGVLNLILGGAMKLVGIPYINSIAAKGIDLPITGAGFSLVNTGINLLDGAFVISADVKKVVADNTLQFKSERHL